MTDCRCYRCTKERVAVDPGKLMFGQPVAMMQMFLCDACGNKRCPHAADHRLACSGSNEPGQPGSLYEAVPTPTTPRSPTMTEAEGMVERGDEAGDFIPSSELDRFSPFMIGFWTQLLIDNGWLLATNRDGWIKPRG